MDIFITLWWIVFALFVGCLVSKLIKHLFNSAFDRELGDITSSQNGKRYTLKDGVWKKVD